MSDKVVNAISADERRDKVQGVRGMNDVLPADEALWARFEDAIAGCMRSYGYQRIRTPIVEQTRLFVRGIGAVTDIVEKEMYSFEDALNGERLTLRPENTAGVVRAVIEHNLLYDGPKRLWYAGPMFRHERPQRGRYRQFHQVGAEAMGMAGPDADAEVILLCRRLWDDLDLPDVKLEINSLGSSSERAAHRSALIDYLQSHASLLDADAQRRLHSNPLRILDSKNPAMQAIVEAAPRLADFLGDESKLHFDGLQHLLKMQNLPFRINHRLVRGLDYYNATVFEWVAGGLTICGGGRYDPLIEMLGGKPGAACGMALGVERVLDLMRGRAAPADLSLCDIYLVQTGEGTLAVAQNVAERLRDAGLDVLMHCGGGSLKSQFKRADGSGAELAVVIGPDEVANETATIKWLRRPASDAAQQQTQVAQTDLAGFIVDALVADNG